MFSYIFRSVLCIILDRFMLCFREFHRQLCETLGLDEDILQGLKVTESTTWADFTKGLRLIQVFG